MPVPNNTFYICRNISSGEMRVFDSSPPADLDWEVKGRFVSREEYDILAERLDKGFGSGLSTTAEAYRYAQIHKAVEDMGGFANFSAWVTEHAKDYFMSLEQALSVIDVLVNSTSPEKLRQAQRAGKNMLQRYSGREDKNEV